MKYRICRCILSLAVCLVAIRCEQPAVPTSSILVLANQNGFGLYTAEILRAEGFASFKTDSIANVKVNGDYLNEFDIVILAATALTEAQAKMLTGFVGDGGNLIAFRPDKRLSEVFGIDATGSEVSEGYIAIRNQSDICSGITAQSLQLHVTADRYSLSGAELIADLLAAPGKDRTDPAVVINAFKHGKAIAFLYNLPESILLTRQGNFRDAGKEMDGIPGIRAMDLFTHGWVDTSRNTLNQADEQMHLLSHSIEHLATVKKPIPRFWYFPDTLNCLVTLNNDGEDSKEADFGPQFEDVESKGAKMTIYIKEVELVSKTWTDRWAGKGFEISGHPDDTRQAINPDWKTMDSVYKNLQDRLKTQYAVMGMPTVTNHWFVWVGKDADGTMNFAAQARIEENNGIGLDCNYAHYDNGSSEGHFLGQMGINQGNYTGSGLPMKFADANGGIIDVYQQLNNVYDQQYMEHKDQDGYFNAFKGLMDRSLHDQVYSTISVKAHNNEYYFSKIPLMKMLDYANEQGIPVWTQVQLLDFLKMRDEAQFTDINWSDNALTFEIHSTVSTPNGLTFLVPAKFAGKKIKSLSLDGKQASPSLKTIKGTQYARGTIKSGSDVKVEIRYSE